MRSSPIEADLWSYSHLLSMGRQVPLGEANDASEADLEWIGELGPEVRNVLNRGIRIAQESLNWDWLRLQKRPAAKQPRNDYDKACPPLSTGERPSVLKKRSGTLRLHPDHDVLLLATTRGGGR